MVIFRKFAKPFYFKLKDKFVKIQKFNIIIIVGAELFHFLKMRK